MDKEKSLAFLQSCIDNIDINTREEIKKAILELTKDSNTYINLAELTKRFVKIDKYYNHEPWNLLQILANFNLMIPIKINNWIPVSSGILPNNTDNVNVTILIDEVEEVAIGFYSQKYNKWHICTKDDIDFRENIYEIIAWKPLPQPYKEKE